MYFQISMRAARVNAGKTQSDAANKLNVSKATIISWEKGRTAPSAVSLKELCSFYGCPLDAIFLR